ncbi:MAG: alpha amylase C-terminal domain-containing protein, partial [Clostridia bacterium]|nr:alpha amylase C-terminal domain-containing protein [Clostridia bacterium]
IRQGKYRLVFNTDLKSFGGDGKKIRKTFTTKKIASHGKEYSISIDIPRLSCIYLKSEIY